MTRRRAAFSLALAVLVLASAPVAGADGAPAPVDASPLASNGFSSPSCTAPELGSQLSAAQRTDCAVSGVDVEIVAVNGPVHGDGGAVI